MREISPSRYLDNSDATKRRSSSTTHITDKSPVHKIIIRRSKGPKVKRTCGANSRLAHEEGPHGQGMGRRMGTANPFWLRP